LAQKAAGVIVIEVDRNLETVLEETLAGLDNVEIFWGNALDTDFDDLVSSRTGGPDTTGGKPYKAVANLPYYITTPLIMHALEGHFNISLMVIMVQKEVADRITAVPGTKAYGALTLAVNYYCEPRVAFKVPRTVFIPQPEVDSAVVCLKRRDNPPAFVEDEQIFFRVIRAAFGQRRKTLANALYSAAFGPEKDDINKMLSALGIDPKRRGETLSFNEFAMIANKMHIMLEHK
jgi:16S rRNA (adenine1518-N6/adenine1519-N6)-dimethyltransferase